MTEFPHETARSQDTEPTAPVSPGALSGRACAPADIWFRGQSGSMPWRRSASPNSADRTCCVLSACPPRTRGRGSADPGLHGRGEPHGCHVPCGRPRSAACGPDAALRSRMDAAGVVTSRPGHQRALVCRCPVIALVIPMGPHGGTYAEQIVAGEASVVRAPEGCYRRRSGHPAAQRGGRPPGLGCARPQRGQAVAVTGAAGAVGGYAIQLAKARGLTWSPTPRRAARDAVGVLGADHVVARGAGFAGQVRALVPGGVPGLVDGANLDAAALRAIADGARSRA